MQPPEIPEDEDRRLQSLRAYQLLDTLPELEYDDIVRVASRLLEVPIAAISLVDEDRQWFKARVGLEASQTSREVSFCGHAVASDEMLVVPDASLDDRFNDNPLVTGELAIRFYAGAPLRSSSGQPVGTLCIIDQQARELSEEDRQLLQALARQVMQLFELRRRVQQAELVAEQLRAAQHAIEAANRAKSDFLASMSHELRTPLNSVIGFTNLLRKNKAGNLLPRDLDFLERIGTNGSHLLRLINDVLDLSKVEAGRVELECVDVDLCSLVTDVLEQLEGQAREANVTLRAVLPPRARPVLTDRSRMQQVLINLVGNGIKFAVGGRVELRLRVDDEGTPLQLEVVDDGIGIEPKDQERIFESFHQVDPSPGRRFGGTGLGLPLSRSLCETMGFTLGVCSEPGRGSSFVIGLRGETPVLAFEPPQAAESAGGKAPARAAGAEIPGENPPKTVLVIDDDSDSRAVLEALLADYGARVIAVDSGERALDMARAMRPDLITLDLFMPDLDGWAVLRELSADPELGGIPIVICSVADGFSRASVAGAAAVLAKPIERTSFYAILDEALGPKEH